MPRFRLADGTELAYDDHHRSDGGGGEPLLLLHGIFVSRAQWRPQIEALAARYRLITVDLRGHGESSSSDGPYSVAQLAGDMVALLDHLGLSRVICCGHSFGGYVAQELAINHPERVRALVLAETLYGMCSTPLEAALSRAAVALAEGVTPERLTRALASYFGSLSTDGAQLIIHEARRFVGNAAEQRKVVAASLGFDSRGRLHRIACPTLLVTGQIPHIPQVQAQVGEMWWRIPHARWTFISCAGHLLHWDNPKEFNATLVRFIDRLAPEDAACAA